MIVYQTDPETGIFLGTATADESPLEEGVFLIPRGCRTVPPPETAEGQIARWSDGGWLTETIPKPTAPEGHVVHWGGHFWYAEPVPPPEIPEGHQARWLDGEWVLEAIPEPPTPPDSPGSAPPKRLFKATVWRRVSDQEAELLDAAFQSTPLRLRRLLEAATYLDIEDPDFPLIEAAAVSALGPERAAEVLAPEF